MSALLPLLLRCFALANIPTENLYGPSRNIIEDTSTGQKYYAKTGTNVLQMQGEAAGLCAMASSLRGFVPEVYEVVISEDGEEAGMVSQYFDLSSCRGSEAQKQLGWKLAMMHASTERVGKFEFDVPTHCGVTEQDNTWEGDCSTFFRDRRLGDLVRRIGDEQISTEWERLKERHYLPHFLTAVTRRNG